MVERLFLQEGASPEVFLREWPRGSPGQQWRQQGDRGLAAEVRTPNPSMLSFFIVLGWDMCLVLGMAYVTWVRWLLCALIVVCTAVKSLLRGFDVMELAMSNAFSEGESEIRESGAIVDERKDKKY